MVQVLGQTDSTSSNIVEYNLVGQMFDGNQTLFKTIQTCSTSLMIIVLNITQKSAQMHLLIIAHFSFVERC